MASSHDDFAEATGMLEAPPVVPPRLDHSSVTDDNYLVPNPVSVAPFYFLNRSPHIAAQGDGVDTSSVDGPSRSGGTQPHSQAPPRVAHQQRFASCAGVIQVVPTRSSTTNASGSLLRVG